MAEKTQCLPSAAAPAEPDAAFAALRVLLDYLFLGVRMRDGVPVQPLFDRLDFVGFVDEVLHAPAAEHTAAELQGLRWLNKYTQALERERG
jgi:hypothetical protein